MKSLSRKQCFRCGGVYPLHLFYPHPKKLDGYLNKCKECYKLDVKTNREKNKKYYRDFDRNRDSLPHRVAARLKYSKTDAYKLSCKKSKEKWNLRNKEKKRIYTQVQQALNQGEIVQRSCQVCGSLKSHAHHSDYSKPLDVLWLCHIHHMKLHKELREKGRAL